MPMLKRGRATLITMPQPSIARRSASPSPASRAVAWTFGLRKADAVRFASSPSTSAAMTSPIASLAARWRATTEPTAPHPIRRTFGGPEGMLSNLVSAEKAEGHEPCGGGDISLTPGLITRDSSYHGVFAGGPASSSRRRPGSAVGREHAFPRSEEHTSELQSHVNLVCRLLLEK